MHELLGERPGTALPRLTVGGPLATIALHEPRWRNWQTRMVEGHVDRNVRAGSSPALGTIPGRCSLLCKS